jgi:hypothetical protein
MKELSIEEKARAYDRVSKEVKDFFEGRQKMYSDVSQTLEYLFPELKESEDEKMKNWILDELRLSYHRAAGDRGREDELSKAIAWLEKQQTMNPKEMRDLLRMEYSKGRYDAITKAIEWLEEHLLDYWGQQNSDPSEFIVEFKKVMEEQL